jgi:hypothetical protein
LISTEYEYDTSIGQNLSNVILSFYPIFMGKDQVAPPASTTGKSASEVLATHFASLAAPAPAGNGVPPTPPVGDGSQTPPPAAGTSPAGTPPADAPKE